jgi:hypothetical protein
MTVREMAGEGKGGRGRARERRERERERERASVMRVVNEGIDLLGWVGTVVKGTGMV